jgi:lysophospholipase L1-like esterase
MIAHKKLLYLKISMNISLVLFTVLACQFPKIDGDTSLLFPLETPFDTTATQIISLTDTPTTQPKLTITASSTPLPLLELTSAPSILELDINIYQRGDGQVTVNIPEGGRYIVVGDSLSYGSTMSGRDTYDDICNHRWPYVEQLASEIGILTTANLDRGDSMKTPFYSQVVRGRKVDYCQPPPEMPTLSTAVAGSNSNEWLEDLLFHPVFIETLESQVNSVVLFMIGADIFAEKIGKDPITVDKYEQNIGQILENIVKYHKLIYIAHIPHVRIGSFISESELQETNQLIDQFNQKIDHIIQDNGYLSKEKGWVDFGQTIIQQDNLIIWVNAVQPGPFLDQYVDTFPNTYYAKDGLHFHAEGYNQIGSAWVTSLKSEIKVLKAIQENP